MSTRRPIIAGNWKLNCTVAESLELASAVRNQCSRHRGVDVVIAPTALAVYPVAQRLADSPIGVAAQNCHDADKGAFTGELAPPHIKAAGAGYCIIGHSERRTLFGETDAGVAAKARRLLDNGLIPIICVGESLAVREAGNTEAVVGAQVKAALSQITADEVPGVVIAYEPIWAIGTGRTASPAQAQAVHAYLRTVIAEVASVDAAEQVRIQYGGSVKPKNVDALMAQPDIDGALVGGASLSADSFARIVAFREDS